MILCELGYLNQVLFISLQECVMDDYSYDNIPFYFFKDLKYLYIL